MRLGRAGLAIGVLLTPVAADAHPVHEVVQNAYITLAPGRIALDLELTAGPKVAGRVLRALDRDGDRRITPAEARAYADGVLARSRLTIDGRPAALRTIAVDVPPYPALLRAYGMIRIRAEAPDPPRAGGHVLAWRNGYAPADSRCDANVFVKGGGRAAYRIERQDRSADGRALTVRYSVRTG